MFGRKRKPIDSTALVIEGWRLTTQALQRLASEPSEHEWWVQVAGRWGATAVMPPAVIGADRRVPMGFAARPEGFVQDAAATQRALDAMAPLIDAGLAPELLLPLRAELQFGWRRWNAAEQDWLRAIEVLAGQGSSTSRQRWELERRIKAARKARTKEPMLTAENHQMLHESAERIGGRAANATEFAPLRTDTYPAGPMPGAPEPVLAAAQATMEAAGYALMAWFEHVGLAEKHEKPRAVAGLWVVDDVTGVGSGVMGTVAVTDVETQLSDGRVICTTQGRARNFFLGGPWVDVLHVDACVPVTELVALHQARVQALLATTSGLVAVAFRTPQEWLAMQEVQRQRKVEHRLAVGLSEAEARGIPYGPPDVFVPLLQARAVEACRAAWEQAQAAAGSAAEAA